MAAPSLRAWSIPGPDSFAKRIMLCNDHRGSWALDVRSCTSGPFIASSALELAATVCRNPEPMRQGTCEPCTYFLKVDLVLMTKFLIAPIRFAL